MEKGSNEIVLKAMGRAINKTVMIAELIKRRIAGIHENTSIGSMDITDTWEPLEEGLLPLETTRHVSVITITLSKKELDTSSAGLAMEHCDYLIVGDIIILRASTSNDNNGVVEYNGDGGWDSGRGYGARGRGWGRGRGFRGRGRGYGGGDMQQELGGYNGYGGSEPPPAQGRGRGRGRSRGRGRGWDFRSDGPIQAAA
ncbi:Ribonuclease P protein subunit p25-like protein [Camellia lanceoleosa]|uniref:Ribonuclease P protein subunit p25-like protein n=1 Tax=Camellia lanceoleosa TaxID=1840588 RepID=A0ACC0HT22_9ERIC|nr:Ribonuclease P protein subunit p25-like protein [Camellia lanceoleosa]